MVDLELVGVTLLNIVATVSVVLVNKVLLTMTHGSVFQVLLCSYICTTVFSRVFVYFSGINNQADSKRCPVFILFPISLGVIVTVVLQNLLLQNSSVGLTQLSKFLTLPWAYLLDRIVSKSLGSWKLIASLATITIGVGCASYTELRVNVSGAVLVALTVVLNPASSLLNGFAMRKYKLGSAQLQQDLGPWCCLTVGVGVLLENDRESLHALTASLGVMALVAMSAITGLSVNMSVAYMASKCTLTTIQVLSNVKSCLLLLAGILFFGDAADPLRLFGIVVTMVGFGCYVSVKASEVESPKKD